MPSEHECRCGHACHKGERCQAKDRQPGYYQEEKCDCHPCQCEELGGSVPTLRGEAENYTEADNIDSNPILSALRNRALAAFAEALNVKPEFPVEEPPAVVWVDSASKRNAFFISVNKPNYASLRVWTLCINTGIKIDRERLDRLLGSDAPVEARKMMAGGHVPEETRDWSRWKVIMLAETSEVVETAQWMGRLAKARLDSDSPPPWPPGLGSTEMHRIFDDDHLHQFHTPRGFGASLKNNPYPT